MVGNKAGIKLDLKYENELFCKSPQPNDIAKAMFEIVSQHKSMSIYARERAKKMFDISNWIERHEIIFSSFIKNK